MMKQMYIVGVKPQSESMNYWATIIIHYTLLVLRFKLKRLHCSELQLTFFPNIGSVPTKSSKDDAAEGQFTPGDNVEVIEGELINLQGKIVSVEGNKIVMQPFHDDLKVGGL